MPTPVPGGNPDDPGFVYDELSYFEENCDEFGLDSPVPVKVERVSLDLEDGRVSSALKWGDGSPRVVFLHGGAQNAHTWDTVALALRPMSVLAIDLSGHGHSSWRTDGAYGPRSNADDAAATVDRYAPEADLVVGMSLGGLTANAMAATYPWLVRRLIVVDVTPGVTRDKAADIHAFIEGPQAFGSFQEIFDRTVEFNPTRTLTSLRRGILHNAHRVDGDGWEWNYDRSHLSAAEATISKPSGSDSPTFSSELWEDVADVTAPYLLVRGSLSPVVDDADVAELMKRQPDAGVEMVDGAGHSIQGDRPMELAAIIRRELGEP